MWFVYIDANRRIDRLQDEITKQMDAVRSELGGIVNDTKRIKGGSAKSRVAQQNVAVKKFTDVARMYQDVQDKYKKKYQDRIEREIRVARPDASVDEVKRQVRSGNTKAFATALLSNRIGDNQRVLREVEDRHTEIMKIEKSVNELATLFQDMNLMIQVYSYNVATARIYRHCRR